MRPRSPFPSSSYPGDNFSAGGSNELLEFVQALAGTSLTFAIFISGGQVFQAGFLINLVIATVTCGLGFVVHELAHRVVARAYGAEAHFVAQNRILLIAIPIAFFGFFIAAPGAVWHRGYLTTQQVGIVAWAGPASNIVLSVLFLALFYLLPPTGIVSWGLFIGFTINAWLGLFNMIPADPIDGAKIWRWNKIVFGATVACALVLVALFFTGTVRP